MKKNPVDLLTLLFGMISYFIRRLTHKQGSFTVLPPSGGIFLPLASRNVTAILKNMGSIYSRRIAAWAVFIIGFFLMLLGTALLLRYVARISRTSIFLSFLFLITGFLFVLFAIKLSRRPTYVFIAAFLLMVGFFIFLSALRIIPRHVLFRAWPLLSVFAGLALLPAGMRHYGTFLSKFVVPSCSFIVLGLVLLIFSFDIVTFSFRQFILDWWPVFIILVGIIMVLVSLGSRNCPGDHGQ